MAMEIERKFLVHAKPWLETSVQGTQYTQGYLSTDKDRVIRVRLCERMGEVVGEVLDEAPEKPDFASDTQITQSPCTQETATAYITIKSHVSALSATEYEYAIPPADARILLDTLAAQPLIKKIRYLIPHEKHIWHVDFFLGLNAGLVMAEIELNSETESFSRPSWLGEEVSHDMRYKNVHLHSHPFTTW